MSRRSDIQTVEWRFRLYFYQRHLNPESRITARQCLRILKAHRNYLHLLEAVHS